MDKDPNLKPGAIRRIFPDYLITIIDEDMEFFCLIMIHLMQSSRHTTVTF